MPIPKQHPRDVAADEAGAACDKHLQPSVCHLLREYSLGPRCNSWAFPDFRATRDPINLLHEASVVMYGTLALARVVRRPLDAPLREEYHWLNFGYPEEES